MTAATVAGTVVGPAGIARWHPSVLVDGKPFELDDVVSDMRRLPPSEFRYWLPRSIPLTFRHGHRVGDVRYLERSDELGLVAVATVDWLTLETLTAQPLYLSVDAVAHRDDGFTLGDLELRAIGLTTSPALIGQRAVTVAPGSVDEARNYLSGRRQPETTELLRRAGQYRADRRTRRHRPLEIVDVDPVRRARPASPPVDDELDRSSVDVVRHRIGRIVAVRP